MGHERVPVFIYHSIADNGYGWKRLSLPVELFERQVSYLSRNGFRAVTLSELYGIIKSGARPPVKTLALTFDDGFLDNWVYAYPILKRFGLKATVFVNPRFVYPSCAVRPTIDDLRGGRIKKDELKWCGYASWQELKAMSADGTFDVQSHGMTHNWYFSGNRIVDFLHPGDPYYWLRWNLRPEEKRLWLTSDPNGDDSAYGHPVYEFGRGLVVRRFFDDRGLADLLTAHVAANGGKDFFNRGGWKEELYALASGYAKSHMLVERMETKDEYLARIRWEFTESRLEIERHTGREVRFLSWPNGGYSEEAHRVAVDECGYLATVTTSEQRVHGQRDDLIGRVYFGQEYEGTLSGFVRHLKFVFAVESRCGRGARSNLVRFYQKAKNIKKILRPVVLRAFQKERIKAL